MESPKIGLLKQSSVGTLLPVVCLIPYLLIWVTSGLVAAKNESGLLPALAILKGSAPITE